MSASTLPPLLQRLIDERGAERIEPDTLAAFVARPGDRVLFLSGDPVQFPEGLDVAVVLPELQAALPGRFSVGVVPLDSQEAIARRFGSQRWPALVFLRDGEYVTTLAGMHDWTDYLERVTAALSMPTSRAPGIGIPLVSAASASSCH
jgi:hydrogenase-1 operon protein HyaE